MCTMTQRGPVVHRRGMLVVVLLVALVVGRIGLQIASGAAGPASPPPTPPPPRAASPVPATPTAAPDARADRAVAASLAAVQHAFNAGDVPRMCGPGGLVDPAVIRLQQGSGGGCEAEVETLMSDAPPLALTVGRVTVRPDLASVAVTTARGDEVLVDMVRDGGRWLLSFSQGNDPLPVLAGTE